MSKTSEQIMEMVSQWRAEDDKFSSGNSAAGTRARKALAELSKLIKARRNEITVEKNDRKAARTAKK